MSLYEQMGQTPNMQQAVSDLKANPGSFLKSRGFNIPANMSNPEQITRYLVQSGQVGNGRLQMLMRMLGRR